MSAGRKTRIRVITPSPEPVGRKRDESRLLARIRLLVGARTDFLVTRINTGVFSAPGKLVHRDGNDPLTGEKWAPQTTAGRMIRSAPNGFPDLIGTQLRRVMARHVQEHTFGRHERDYWHYYGQAIAIETKSSKGLLSDSQAAWKRSFEAMGGLYVLARSESDVIDLLGPVTERLHGAS